MNLMDVREQECENSACDQLVTWTQLELHLVQVGAWADTVVDVQGG